MYSENGVFNSDEQISSWEIVRVVLKKDFNLEVGMGVVHCLSGGVDFGHVFLVMFGNKSIWFTFQKGEVLNIVSR